MSEIVLNSCNSEIVGAKAASLARLAQLNGIRIPSYFVVATTAFDAMIANRGSIVAALDAKEADCVKVAAIARAIRDAIRATDFPAGLADDVVRAYRELGRGFGEEDPPVSVRSSATAEDGRTASFAGQYTTCLNIRGAEFLLAAIRRVLASTFGTQAVRYRKRQHASRSPVRMAVIVQRMVDVAAAGTIYTVDPETGVPMICINAVPGLGAADVSGECTPTSWIIDSTTATVIRRRDSPGSAVPLQAGVLLELVRQVDRIGAHFRERWGIPTLELEYAVDHEGHIYFTQVRPETVWSRRKARLTAVDLDKAAHVTRIFQGGMTGCPGVASGMLRIARNLAEAEAVAQPGDILVTPNTANVWEQLFGRIGGIVTEIGGTGSHTAVVMRELGKPALVGAAGGMETLAAYRNRPVTLDATQRLVFVGTRAAELTHRLTTVVPAYGGADDQSEDAAWAEACSQPGRTWTDDAGRRWIAKPAYPVCRFTQSVLLNAHRWAGGRIKVPVTNRIEAGVHWIAFSDVMQWRVRLRGLELSDLERLQQERESAMADYLNACSRFEPAHRAIRDWLEHYVKVNAFIGLGFDIYKVTEGLLEEALAKAHIVEPYYTQIRGAREELGELESSRAARDLFGLAAEAREDPRLAAAISTVSELRSSRPILVSGYEDFYDRLVGHARSFKVTTVAEIDLPEHDALLALVGAIRDLLASDLVRHAVTKPFAPSDGVQFFPEDEYLHRVHRLALAAEKARQDSHHLRVRGHWRIRDSLHRLAAYSVNKGRIGSSEELFDHSPDWLLEQVDDQSGSAVDAKWR